MEILIIAVISGIGIAYFATQNPMTVPVTIASYHFFDIPLYILVTGALLFGLLVAWIISLFRAFGNSILFHRQSSRIEKDNKIIEDLTKKVHALEVENARLKEKSVHVQTVDGYERPSLLTKFRHSF